MGDKKKILEEVDDIFDDKTITKGYLRNIFLGIKKNNSDLSKSIISISELLIMVNKNIASKTTADILVKPINELNKSFDNNNKISKNAVIKISEINSVLKELSKLNVDSKKLDYLVDIKDLIKRVQLTLNSKDNDKEAKKLFDTVDKLIKINSSIDKKLDFDYIKLTNDVIDKLVEKLNNIVVNGVNEIVESNIKVSNSFGKYFSSLISFLDKSFNNSLNNIYKVDLDKYIKKDSFAVRIVDNKGIGLTIKEIDKQLSKIDFYNKVRSVANYGGSSVLNLRNKDDVIINPATEDKQDDIIDALSSHDPVGLKNVANTKINPSTEDKQDDIISNLENNQVTEASQKKQVIVDFNQEEIQEQMLVELKKISFQLAIVTDTFLKDEDVNN